MASTISLNTWSYINQNTDLETTNRPAFLYDYQINVDLGTYTSNGLFATRTYVQNGSDANLVDVCLSINANFLFNVFNASNSLVSAYDGSIVSRGMDSDSTRFGQRLLEILAIKIFGHGKARAAISNDSAFYLQSLYNTLSNSMNDALNTDKLMIFGQYVNMDRVQDNSNDSQAYNDLVATSFNFSELVFEFPIRLNGSLIDSNSSSALKNGPSVGGALLRDGNYDIPLSVKFVTQPFWAEPTTLTISNVSSDTKMQNSTLSVSYDVQDFLGPNYRVNTNYTANNASNVSSIALEDPSGNRVSATLSGVTLTRKYNAGTDTYYVTVSYSQSTSGVAAKVYKAYIALTSGVSATASSATYTVEVLRTFNSMSSTANNNIYTIAVNGSDVYIGGDQTGNVSKYSGSSWTDIGSSGSLSTVRGLTYTASRLYAGGHFMEGTKFYNGTSWQNMGGNINYGTNDSVYAVASIGSTVYVGGQFTGAYRAATNTLLTSKGLIGWNGSEWFALAGLGSSTKAHTVYAIGAKSGSEIYVGGEFTEASGNGTTAKYFAMWNGSSYSAVGTGVNNAVYSIHVSGSDVYAGGLFTTAGGVTVNYIAKWNGSSWSALGSGVNGIVRAILVVGTDVYVGGDFTSAGGVSGTAYIAKYSTTSNTWSSVGTLNGSVLTLALAADGESVYIGGQFTTAGGSTVNHITRYGAVA